MGKRNWRLFWAYAIRSLKHVGWGIVLVPLFFFLMNPDSSAPNYWFEMARSTRIGFQIAMIYWVIMTGVYAIVFVKNPDDIEPKKVSIKFQILTGIPIMLFGIWVSAQIEKYLNGSSWGIRGYTTSLLIGGITFSLLVIYYSYKRTVEHNLKLKVESAESSLNVLKNQMQPHFLFNSLNSLSELIAADKSEASVMAQKLSDLYREILENSKKPLCSLESEVGIIEKYLELEKLRFGERLSYNITVPESSANIFLPSLTLQTLVENAIKHGVSKCVEGGHVDIKIEKEGSGYKAKVQNTSESVVSLNKRGTGIENTKSRLNLLYGDSHGFRLINENQKTTASFWFHGVANA